MKQIFNFSSSIGWILLLCLVSLKAWPQLTPAIDSAIRAEFIANAKRINEDLIKGDFAQKRADNLALQLKDCQDQNGPLKAIADAAQASEKKAVDQAAADRKAIRMARLENLGWRLLALLALYKAVR